MTNQVRLLLLKKSLKSVELTGQEKRHHHRHVFGNGQCSATSRSGSCHARDRYYWNGRMFQEQE